MHLPCLRTALLALAFATTAAHADPILSSWFTAYSGKYARIYVSGSAVTTWTNCTQVQSLPAYCGIQQIDYDAGWVYLTTTGLGSHIMGPWQNGSFPNLPKNQKAVYKIPRVTDFVSAPATKTYTGLGVIGYFVDGVGMFDSRDAFYWNGSTDANGTGYWNRNAYYNEGTTFDAAYAHQQNTGTYHYHADPIALRYLLADHVTYNAGAKTYAESTAAITRHSPILGWAADGYPIYGPCGYAKPMDATSGLTRMRTGFTLRNGSNGTDSLTSTGRTSLPHWTVTLGYSYTATTTGPAVAAAGLGKYLEDYAYLGDLISPDTGLAYVQSALAVGDFELHIYNGRSCVTPEFPGGVYAYFTAINASGTPVFPYNIGRAFRGNATGATATVPGAAANYAKTGPATQEVIQSPAVNNTTGDVTLTWSSVEGGTYKLEATSNLTGSWTTLSSNVSATTNAVQTTAVESGGATANARRFYRTTRTALASYDGGGTGGSSSVAPGGSAARGTTVTVTITLPTTPPQPPLANVPTSVTLAGTITGTAISRPATSTVLATFAIPAGAPTGAKNIVVTFTPATTYTMTGAFTIN